MTANAFQALDRSLDNHFLLNFYVAVFVLTGYLQSLKPSDKDPLPEIFERYPFLEAYIGRLMAFCPEDLTWDEGVDWLAGQILAWEFRRRSRLPLATLQRAADIGFAERVGLLCAGLVEEDARFGELFEEIQGAQAGPRPTVELVGRIILFVDPERARSPGAACEPLLSHGLLLPENEGQPHARWNLRIPSPLWQLLRPGPNRFAIPWCRHADRRKATRLRDLIFPQGFMTELRRVPAVLKRGAAEVLVLRGTNGSDRRRIAGALARSLRRGCFVLTHDELSAEHARLLGPLCLAAGALPLIEADLGPGEQLSLPPLTGYQGPIIVAIGPEGGLENQAGGRVLSLTLPPLGPEERARVWEEGFAGHPVEGIEQFAQRFLMPGAHIRHAAEMALAYAALDRRGMVGMTDVVRARRSMHRQALDSLATAVEVRPGWNSLVVNSTVQHKLQELERRCVTRETLQERLGPAFGSEADRGVRALFNGPSGTGKTLAAQVLAGVLGMDLYRADLASIINKYIGETEKNLNRVLARAEELDVILLLDEGDALMGKRTEVQSANDRYANLETNYLLQRLERHQGVVFVTTNAGEYIDTAFQRRMDVVVDFQPPDAQQRELIWDLHLPTDHSVPAEEVSALASRCELTGGQIRNAAQLATLWAMNEREGRLCIDQLWHAINEEYRKAGALSPLHRSTGMHRHRHGGMDAFLAALYAE